MKTDHKTILNLHHLSKSLLASVSVASINFLLVVFSLLILIGSVTSIFFDISLNPYWSQHPILAAGTATGITLLSSYVAYLVMRLRNIGSGPSSSPCLPRQDEQRSEADWSPEKKQISCREQEVQKPQQRRILVLSSNSLHAEEIGRLLQSWHHDFTLCRTTVQAFQKLLNSANDTHSLPYDILLVDHRALEIDPLQIAAIKHQEPALLDTVLIYLGPPQQKEHRQSLRNAGYSQQVETPMSKPLLFTAIRASSHFEKPSKDVVSLVSRLKQQSAKLPPRDILLAEPNLLDRGMFERILKHAGHKVYSVENGDQALDALKGHHFDLAIIDLEMPVINGLQIAKLHRITHTPHHWLPFIAMVRDKTPQIIRACEEVKIEACLAKPVISSELLKAVKVVTSQNPGISAHSGLLSSDNQYVKTAVGSQISHLLDASVLENLERLDENQDFLNSLISIFFEESKIYLKQMRDALNGKRYQVLTDNANLLVDSSGQLGAVSFYRYSLYVSRMRPDELNKAGTEMLDQLNGLFTQTKQAFLDYITSRDRDSTDQI